MSLYNLRKNLNDFSKVCFCINNFFKLFVIWGMKKTTRHQKYGFHWFRNDLEIFLRNPLMIANNWYLYVNPLLSVLSKIKKVKRSIRVVCLLNWIPFLMMSIRVNLLLFKIYRCFNWNSMIINTVFFPIIRHCWCKKNCSLIGGVPLLESFLMPVLLSRIKHFSIL